MLSDFPILFEDADLLVINKPAGLVVNDAQTVRESETVQSWLRHRLSSVSIASQASWQALIPENFVTQYGSPEEIFSQRGGIVHRLDKNTSGVLILAKNPGSLVNLLAQFKERRVEKQYLCLVHGWLAVKSDTINLPIARSYRDAKKLMVRDDGRSAVTRYEVEGDYRLDESRLGQLIRDDALADKVLKDNAFSLVKCWPQTGRMHQIRVHFAHLKHPLVGDEKYVGRKRAKLDHLWCPRQFLHASEITFFHPRSGKKLTIEAKLAEDLLKVNSLLFT